MASEHIVKVDAANWDAEVLKASGPVLVDFWAEWCGPCRALAPTLDAVATELAGKIKIAKCNVDDNAPLASQFGIRSIPTLLVFKAGKVQGQMVGALNKADLTAKLSAYL